MELEYLEYEPIPFVASYSPFTCQLNKSVNPESTSKIKWHEQLEIKYIISGELESVCNSDFIRAEAGDVIMINPCERHMNHLSVTSDTRYHVMLIDISEKYTGFLYKQYFAPLLNGSRRFCNLIRDEKIVGIVKELFDVFQSSQSTMKIEAYSVFLKLITELQSSSLCVKSDSVSANKKWHKEIVNTALNYIFENYQNPIHLREIADACYITEAHLCRVFKSETGKSPISFIIEFRINKAIVFLTLSKLSIKETAARCGFSDCAYFSRCFKIHMGISPSEYIKNILTDDKEETK